MRACVCVFVFPNGKHRLCVLGSGGGAIVPTAMCTIIPGMNKNIECNFNGFWKFCSCCAVGTNSIASHRAIILMLG